MTESENGVLNFLTLESESESYKKQGLRIPGIIGVDLTGILEGGGRMAGLTIKVLL